MLFKLQAASISYKQTESQKVRSSSPYAHWLHYKSVTEKGLQDVRKQCTVGQAGSLRSYLVQTQ